MPQTNDLTNLLFGNKGAAPPAIGGSPAAPKENATVAPRPLTSLLFGNASTAPEPQAQSRPQSPLDAPTQSPADALSSAPEPSAQEPDDEGLLDSISRRQNAIWSDANSGVGGKIWKSLNEPLIDAHRIENWTGGVDRDENGNIEGGGWTSLGGLHAGASELAAGFTSPLSLLLLLGGPAGKALGVFEGAGESLLTRSIGAGGAGMDAATAQSVVRAADFVKRFSKSGLIGEQGLKSALTAAGAAGVDLNAARAGLQTLAKAGLEGGGVTRALESAGTVHSIVSNIARNYGGLPQAERIASGVQAAVDAGFGVHMITGAVMGIPRVQDEFKAYSDFTEQAEKAREKGEDPTPFENRANLALEEAKKLALTSTASAWLGVQGFKGAAHEAGPELSDLAARFGLRFKPSEEYVDIKRAINKHDAAKTGARQGAKVDAENFVEKYKGREDNPVAKGSDQDFHNELKLVDRLIRTGSDLGELAKWREEVEISAGRKEAPPAPVAPPEPPPTSSQTALDSQAGQEGFDAFQKGKTEQRAAASNTSPKEMTPERVRQLLGEQRIKAKYTPEEIDDLLHSMDGSRVRQWHLDMADELTKYLSDSLKFAQDNNALPAGVENYLTQLWKPENNPAANGLKYDINNDGNFTVNTFMARQRILQNAREGWLLGKKLRDFSPVDLTVNNGLKFAEIVASRNLLDTLRTLRMADGRPVVAMSGIGRHIQGSEGGADVEVEDRGRGLTPGPREATSIGRVKVKRSDPATFIDPNRARPIEIASGIVKKLRDSGELQRRLDDGTIVATKGPRIKDSIIQKMIAAPDGQAKLDKSVAEGRILKTNGLPGVNGPAYSLPIFGWETGDYLNADHAALRDWMHQAADSRGNSIYLKSDMLLHPDASNYITKRLGIEPKAPESPFGTAVKGVAAVAREAKGLVLGLSPFHLGQEGLRAIMTGISPINEGRWDARTDAPAHELIEGGLGVGRDYGAMKEFEEGQRAGVMAGNSKLIAKVPGLGRLQSNFHHFLFDYIDNLKVRAGKSLYDRYITQHAERIGMDAERVRNTPADQLSPNELKVREKAAEDAATETNERFGGLNYRRMGRDMNLQQLASIAALAPDWLESEMRFTARLFGDEGSIARQHVATMAAGLWGVARVWNYLQSGSAHLEAPFGVAVKDDNGKEKIYSIRTLPTDMTHMVADPGHFLAGRESPLLRAGIHTMTGRDEFGRRIPGNHVVTNLLEQASPIALQTAVKKATGAPTPQTTTLDQFLKAGGLSVQPFRTEAEKTAAEIASDHSESGPVDPAQVRRHQLKLEMEDRLRAGSMSGNDLAEAVHRGEIRQDEAAKITKEVKATEGLEPSMARLYLRASKMPAGEVLKVWDDASSAEKKMLLEKGVLQKAAKRYFTKSLKEMTAQERDDDPVYQRLRTMKLRPY